MNPLAQTAMTAAEDMRRQLTAKAVEDMEFRQQLVADPKAVIEQEFGISVPDDLNVQVHESSEETLHLALPATPELSEKQLDQIAAGLSCCL